MQAAKKRKVTATRSVDATGSAAPAAAAAVSSGTTKPVDVQLVRHHSMFLRSTRARCARCTHPTVRQAAGSPCQLHP